MWLRNARAANDAAARLAEAAGRSGCCCRSRRTRCSSGSRRTRRRRCATRASTSTTGGPGEARLVTSWDSDPAASTRSPQRSGRCERRPSSSERDPASRRASATQPRDEASFARSLRVLLPFLLITLIWGSTWIVIKDQLGDACRRPGRSPTASSSPARRCSPGPRRAARACASAATRPCRSPPCSGSRNSSSTSTSSTRPSITSPRGLVAVVFALLMVPEQRARLAVPQAAESTWRFVARLGRSPAPASPCCSSRRCAPARVAPARCCSASASPCSASSPPRPPTSCRRAERLRRRPIASLLAWGMVYGVIANAAARLGRRTARRWSRRGPLIGPASSISACSPRRSPSPSISR